MAYIEFEKVSKIYNMGEVSYSNEIAKQLGKYREMEKGLYTYEEFIKEVNEYLKYPDLEPEQYKKSYIDKVCERYKVLKLCFIDFVSPYIWEEVFVYT